MMFPVALKQSESPDEKFIKGGFQAAQVSRPLKTTLDVEKMACPAMGGNPMGGRTDRGVSLWGLLIILSLAACHVEGLYLQRSRNPQNPHPHQREVEFDPKTDCKLCLQGTRTSKCERLGTQLENKRGDCSGNKT